MRIRLAHSPDPDDAFMFYGLASGAVDSGPFEFQHILEDIQTLNERAMRGEYEVSAISLHAYPYVAARYALCSCGCSMGDGYGPMVVARGAMTVDDLRGLTIAIPGRMTTAFLALQLLLGPGSFTPRVTRFDEIAADVARGACDAGLIIHEGQLTYMSEGLRLIVDLGQWWKQHTGLPLPLGGNVIRRDLGESVCRDIQACVRASIRYGLTHRDPSVRYALRYGRGLDQRLADRFVGMYVNDWTLDYGARGREAVRRLLADGAQAGLVPPVEHLEFVE
jgi:1,4-dihydroxy-6-naphthoate synthase